VRKNARQYETFEKMHWVCFHLEFEHGDDPDERCNAGCFWPGPAPENFLSEDLG
jgi:hypothetical protein